MPPHVPRGFWKTIWMVIRPPPILCHRRLLVCGSQKLADFVEGRKNIRRTTEATVIGTLEDGLAGLTAGLLFQASGCLAGLSVDMFGQ